MGDLIDGVMWMSMTTLSQYTPLAVLEGVMTLLPVLDVYCAGIVIAFAFTSPSPSPHIKLMVGNDTAGVNERLENDQYMQYTLFF